MYRTNVAQYYPKTLAMLDALFIDNVLCSTSVKMT